MFQEAKKSGEKSLAPVEKDLGGKLDALVQFANGGRTSIGIKRLHVERALRLVIDGAPVAWTFGARSMSSRVAFVLVVREGDNVAVIAADCRRRDAYKGPASVFQALGAWTGTLEKDIEGETADKREAARANSRGIEIHALAQVTDVALKERLKAFAKSQREKEAGPEGSELPVVRVRAGLVEASKFLGLES